MCNVLCNVLCLLSLSCSAASSPAIVSDIARVYVSLLLEQNRATVHSHFLSCGACTRRAAALHILNRVVDMDAHEQLTGCS